LLHRGHTPAHEQRQATHDGVRPRSPGHQLSSSPPNGSPLRRTAYRNFHLHRAPIAQRLKPSSTAGLIMFRTIFLSSVIAGLAMSGLACRQPSTPAYTPGLGEIMTLTQMRHSKLWFAGEAANWPLASYELDELHEGMDDAATFHPT